MEGHINDYPAFFRARWGSWSLVIARTIDDIGSPHLRGRCEYAGSYDQDLLALQANGGEIIEELARKIISNCVGNWIISHRWNEAGEIIGTIP
jgi:hypothetical protein